MGGLGWLHLTGHVKMFARMYRLGILISEWEADDPNVIRTSASKSIYEHEVSITVISFSLPLPALDLVPSGPCRLSPEEA